MNHFDENNVSIGYHESELYGILTSETTAIIKNIVETHLPFEKLTPYHDQNTVSRTGQIIWNDVTYTGLLQYNYRTDGDRQDNYVVIATQTLNTSKDAHDDPKNMDMYYLNLDSGAFMAGSEVINDLNSTSVDTQTLVEQYSLMGHAGVTKPNKHDVERFLSLIDTVDELKRKDRKNGKILKALANLFYKK